MASQLTMQEVADHFGVGLGTAYRYSKRRDFPKARTKSVLNDWRRQRAKDDRGVGRPLKAI